jgi:uncharacterized protein (UPF0216 family)
LSSPIERFIERDIETINDHLPRTRPTLNELLKLDTPEYQTRIGEMSTFKHKEIEQLANEVPTKFHDEVKLPIVILRRLDLGRGFYSVTGSKPELFLIWKTVGQVNLGWEKLAEWKPIDRMYRPQVQILRRKLPSTTCIGFTTQQEF